MSRSGGGGGMKRKRNNHIPPTFPEDLVVEILTWLPVKSATRFKSLAKLYHSLISQPNFVKTHLRRSALRRPPTALVLPRTIQFPPTPPAVTLLHLPPHHSPPPHHELVHVPFLTADTSLPGDDYSVTLLGACHGLVYIKLLDRSSFDLIYILWNPATRQFRLDDLDDLIDSYKPAGLHHVTGKTPGLGFNPRTGNHEIVFLLTTLDTPVDVDLVHEQDIVDGKDGSRLRIKLVVFSLEENSARELPYDGPAVICNSNWGGTHVDGAIYWDVFYTESWKDRNILLRFDMAGESFCTVKRPDSCRSRNNEHHIGEYKDEYLALFVSPGMYSRKYVQEEDVRNNVRGMEVWLLHSGRYREGWRKVYYVDTEMERIGWPVLAVVGRREEEEAAMRVVIQGMIRRNGGGVLESTGILVYDPVMRFLTLVDSSRGGQDDPKRVVGELSNYVESLLSVYGR